ncbi:4a-hydroxytetrahydrobiopterin dehydratase [Kribbella sp. NBC_01245]|uniref:4a-hydroxytetrahydrobiopterin dehydratase n=1 Tax=Kribbella sp. NBC_01245 TaxID=2903578 RepID=UPI002E2C0E7B|nr:4a-hydroxytetrahydrobiopterin dehydratase [Kribbella sp. NBC_01245]
MPELLTDDQIDLALRDHLPQWKVEDKALVRSVKKATFMDGIRLVATVAQLAESMDHHPDIDIRWTTITFRVWTHVAGGITDNDLVLARHIDTAAG